MTLAEAADTRRRAGPVSAGTWIAVVFGLGLFALGVMDALNFTVDDVFISFRYAENWARRLGPVFNAGERVEGFSNPLWTVMLTAMVRMGWSQSSGAYDLLVAAKIAGIVCAALTLLVLVQWTLRRARGGAGEAAAGIDAVLPLAIALVGGSVSFSLWGVSGMETPMCALAVTLAGLTQMDALRLAETSPARARGRLWLAAALFGVACLTRPEPFFIWALSTASFAWTAPPALRRALAAPAVLTLAIYLATTVARLSYYGAWLPNTVVAKSALTPVGFVLGAKYTIAGLFAAVGFLGLGFIGLPSLWRSSPEWRWLALWCGAWTLFGMFSGGDWMPGYRLIAPVIPLLAVLAVASTGRFLQGAGMGGRGLGLAALVLVGATIGFASERALVRSEWAFPSGLRQRTWESSPLRGTVAADLGNRVTPGQVVAIAEAGYIPYYNMNTRFLDVLGLMDPQFARMPAMDASVFLKRAPDWYLVMIKWGQPSRESLVLLSSPEFRARYRQVMTYDRLAWRMQYLERGELPPLEEEQRFVLYQRVP